MKRNELKARAAQYTKLVEWSDEDGCFVGSAPPLVGPCCHGDALFGKRQDRLRPVPA